MRGLMNLIVALLSSYISLATVSLVNELFLVRKRYDIISNEIVNTCWVIHLFFLFTYVYELKEEHIMNMPFFDNDIFKRVHSFHATKYFVDFITNADGKFLYSYITRTFDTIITKGTLTKQVALHCFVES